MADDASAPITRGGWTISSRLSPAERANLEGLIAVNGSEGHAASPHDDAANSAAAEAAFAAMVRAHSGAKEVAPGIYAVDEDGPAVIGDVAEPSGNGGSAAHEWLAYAFRTAATLSQTFACCSNPLSNICVLLVQQRRFLPAGSANHAATGHLGV